jgi:hypothetical protein
VVLVGPSAEISFLGESLLMLSSDFAKKSVYKTKEMYKSHPTAKAYYAAAKLQRENLFRLRNLPLPHEFNPKFFI